MLQTARLYDALTGSTRSSYSAGSPLLDVTFHDESAILIGALDGYVKRCGSNDHWSVRGPLYLKIMVLAVSGSEWIVPLVLAM